MRRLAAGVVWLLAAALLVAPAPAAAQDGAALFAQAEQALNAGDSAKAVDLYSGAIRSGSLAKVELARAFLSRGRAQQFTGQHARAVADFTNALWLESLSPGDQARAYGWRSVSRQALGQATLASDDLGKARSLDSGFDPGAGSAAIASAPAATPSAGAAPPQQAAGSTGSDGNFFTRIFGDDEQPARQAPARQTTVQREPIPPPRPASPAVTVRSGGDTDSRPGLLTRLLGDDDPAVRRPEAAPAPAPLPAPVPSAATPTGTPRSLLPSSTGTGQPAATSPKPAPSTASRDAPVARPTAAGRPSLLTSILGDRPSSAAAQPAPQRAPAPQRVARAEPAARPAPLPVRPPQPARATGPALDEGSAWTATANGAAPIVRAAASPGGRISPGVSNDIPAQPARLTPPPPQRTPQPTATPTVTASRTTASRTAASRTVELETERPPERSIFSRLFGSSGNDETPARPAPTRASAPPPPGGASESFGRTVRTASPSLGAWDTNVQASSTQPRAPAPSAAPARPRNVEVASLDWNSATRVSRAAPPPRRAAPAATRVAAAPPPRRRTDENRPQLQAAPPPPPDQSASRPQFQAPPPRRTETRQQLQAPPPRQTASRTPTRRPPQPGPEAGVRTNESGYAVQVSARRSLNEAKHDAAQVTRQYADLFGQARPYIVKADVPGKGTFYRVRFGPYRDQPSVAGLCQRLKGRGQDCFAVRP